MLPSQEIIQPRRMSDLGIFLFGGNLLQITALRSNGVRLLFSGCFLLTDNEVTGINGPVIAGYIECASFNVVGTVWQRRQVTAHSTGGKLGRCCGTTDIQ